MIVHQGDSRVRIDGQWTPIPAGHAILMTPGPEEHYEFNRDNYTVHSWIDMKTHIVPKAIQEKIQDPARARKVNQRIIDLMKIGLNTPVIKEPLQDSFLNSLALTIVQEFLLLPLREASIDNPVPPSLQKAMEKIHKDYHEELNLKALAAVSGVTPQHLVKLFRSHMNTTPAKYLWSFRVEAGVHFLRHTGLSISEIAYRTGFQTPFHFSRMVKELNGIPPRQLRKEFWEKNSSQNYNQ